MEQIFITAFSARSADISWRHCVVISLTREELAPAYLDVNALSLCRKKMLKEIKK